MARETSSKPWRKYAAYPGQPEFLPGARQRASTWQDLRKIVSDVEGSPGPPLSMRACGSHWAFSEAAVSPLVMVETNDPDERENPGALRLNRPVFDVLPWQLSAPAVSFFQGQAGVAFNPSILQTAVAVVHVEAGMKIAELYSFLDQESGHHLGQRFPQYQGPWAMPTLGGAGGQTVAGATQTGTHGGDVGLPPIVDAVVAMHLIGAGGRHFWIEKTGEPWRYLVETDVLQQTYEGVEVARRDDLLHAAQVACGRFGIVYSVVLKVVRQHALFEDRTASTWSAVRQWLDSPGVVSASWFTQIVVNPIGQRVNRHEHSAWVTRRWRMPLIAAGTPPAGRAERSGANAGKEVTFDPTDPDARDSFMNRLCEGAHPIRIALDLLIAPLEAARNKALLTAGAAQVGIMAAMAIGFPPPPHLIALRNSALGAAAAAEASILLLEVVKSLAPGTVRINEALGDIANYLAQIDQLWVLRGLADILMGMDQKPRSATAISYALMDIHNYRDWVCSKNGDSIEVFFDAWTPDAKNFLDLVFQRVRQLEDGTLPGSGGLRMAFPGYVAIRFTRATEALLGMQRWGTTVSMEIASINACKGTGPMLRRVHQDALDYLGPVGPRASVHWGQKNTVDMKHVEDAFGAWVTGGRLAQWRSALSELTRNGRDAVFSTEFSRHAGLEVVQPRAYALTAAPGLTCAGSLVSVSWDAENNPPGTQAVLLLTTQTPDAPTRTVGRPSSLRGSAMLEVPPGRHILTLRVSYELNGRTLWDHLTVQVRGIAPGEILTFQFVPSCWQLDLVDRWWVDLNPGQATFAPAVVVETIRLSPSVPGAWRATRPNRPDILLASPTVKVPVPDRPALSGGSWRFLSDYAGCVGPAPTITVEFGLGCSPT